MGAAPVHPFIAFLGVVVGQREMRRAIAQRLAQRHALGVQRIGHGADGRLGAFAVDVPALEMLQGTGVHQDERRVDDGAGIHERAPDRPSPAGSTLG